MSSSQLESTVDSVFEIARSSGIMIWLIDWLCHDRRVDACSWCWCFMCLCGTFVLERCFFLLLRDAKIVEMMSRELLILLQKRPVLILQKERNWQMSLIWRNLDTTHHSPFVLHSDDEKQVSTCLLCERSFSLRQIEIPFWKCRCRWLESQRHSWSSFGN